MTTHNIDSSQHKAARVAGVAYLFLMIGSILHHSIVELNLIVSENTAEIANFIKTNEVLFRIGIVGDLLLFTCGIILSLALYVILRVVNKNLALLALILLAIQAAVSVVIELTSFIALLLLNGEGYLTVFNTEQLQALVGLFLNVRPAGYNVAILFFCPASIIFYFLFYKSEYIPKTLAALGIFSFLLMLIWTFVKIIVPNYSETIAISKIMDLISSVPVLLFQISMGVWFLVKGIKVPQHQNNF